jgi:dihydropteroate synthase
MHLRGTPATMQANTAYDDLLVEILDVLEERLQRAERAGVPRARLWVDPGLGFGKTGAHNLYLSRRLADLRLLGCPVVLGASRKAFLGSLLGGRPAQERGAASAALAAIVAAWGGVDVVRVHDVAPTRDALAVADAVRSARDGGARFSS